MPQSKSLMKFHFFQQQYYQNEHSFQLISSSYVASRSELWNYLKNNNQIFELDWQTVPRDILVSRLKMYWNKSVYLQEQLSLSQISNLMNQQQLQFNDDELKILFSKAEVILRDIVNNIDNYHCLRIYKFIDFANDINKEMFEKEVSALNKYIQKEMRSLLKTMVYKKYIPNSQKEQYLNLKRINFHDMDLNSVFEYHYVSDRTKYILQQSPGSLFKNVNFQF